MVILLPDFNAIPPLRQEIQKPDENLTLIMAYRSLEAEFSLFK